MLSSDGRVERVSASVAVDLGLISSRVTPMTLKLVFKTSLLDVQHKMDSVEKKPASYLLCHWKRYLAGFPHLGVTDS